MSYPPVFVDGRLRVCAERCSTCIFRPGNLMYLSPGRLGDVVRQNLANDAALPCHDTLEDEAAAVCRGFFEAYRTRVTALKLAEAMGIVEWV